MIEKIAKVNFILSVITLFTIALSIAIDNELLRFLGAGASINCFILAITALILQAKNRDL